MSLGAGLCPAGTSSAGFGVPDSGTVPNNALLPDPVTGLPQTGRNVNTATGSYTFTADGRTQGMATVPQLVQLAIKTARGSSALGPFGLDMSKVQEQGTNFERQLSAALSAALANVVKQGLVTLVGLTWLPVDNPDGAAPILEWRDNTTGVAFGTNVTNGATFNLNTVIGP